MHGSVHLPMPTWGLGGMAPEGVNHEPACPGTQGLGVPALPGSQGLGGPALPGTHGTYTVAHMFF